MKNIYKYSLLMVLFSVIIVSSCTDELDKNPPQSLATDIALSTDANVKTVLNGAYDALSNGDLFGGLLMRNSELLAADDEIIFSGTFNSPSEIWRKEIVVTNGDVAEAWLDGYNTINIVNNVLSALDIVDPADKDRVEGEAKFIRGLVYFELAKYFGKAYADDPTSLGVPLVLTPTISITEQSFVSRNTVAEVYAQVISDLTDAQTLLPIDNNEYANSVAASMILSRVYLQQEDYAKARDTADKAINDAAGEYALNNDFIDVFNQSNNTSEDVFAIQVSNQDGTNSMVTFFSAKAYGGRGDIEIQSAHLDFYDPTDLRLSFFYIDPATGDTRSGKWQNQFGNVNVVRLAEAYLTRAECNIRLGTTVGDTPDNDLNLFRFRAGLTDLVGATLDDALLERKLELAHEGQALWDFKRTQGYFYTLNGGDGLVDGFAWDADELVFPIPDREMKVNKNLVQNTGY